MKTQRLLLWLGLAMALQSCAVTREPAVAFAPPLVADQSSRAPDNYALDNLNAVTWSRTSAEARALYLQGFAAAGAALDQALSPSNRASWTAAIEQTGDFSKLPPAIIVDVDETVLDTSDYMLDQIRSGRGYEKPTWNRYVQRQDAPALPGAVEFLTQAAARGVTVFYVSNRGVFDEAEEARKPEAERLYDEDEPTRVNLQRLGFPNTSNKSTFLFRDASRGWKEKGPRRAEIARTHRIIMLVGDNLYDLIDVDPPTRQTRDDALDAHAGWLGSRWIILPNPMYGSWDVLFTAGKTGADARRAKLEAIGMPGPVADKIATGGFEP